MDWETNRMQPSLAPTFDISPIARRLCIAAAALGVIGIVSFSKATQPDATPIGHTEKVIGTPHFFQCDPRGAFPNGGRDYCGPTAVSDSLMYLAQHGFPKLIPNGIVDPIQGQVALINILASPYCMRTNPNEGTDAGEGCAGIERYVKASGYSCRTIEYRGWRQMTGELASYTTASVLSLDWIKRAVIDPHGAAWVNIGWYVHGEQHGEWKRVGGHWVAVVGCGVDGNGQEDPRVLLIDNPANRQSGFDLTGNHPARRRLADGTELPTNEEVADDVMNTVLIGRGRLIGNYHGLPRDAAGMYGVWGPGVDLPMSYDAAFIDGAIVMVIGDRQR